MKKNKNLLWALVGLLVVIVIGGYLYSADPLGWQAEPEMTQQSGSEASPEKSGAGETATASSEQKAGAETEAASAEDKAAGSSDEAAKATAELNKPTFDIVRVEPDGSTLIAGQADPGTAVEIVSGGQVIAKADVGSAGDFAAIVDDRLAPGDYEIVLRSVGEGDVMAQSEEVATISVPKSDPTELLVMVTKPGEASRILSKPEVAEKETAETEIAAAVQAEEAERKVVAVEKGEETAAAEEASSDVKTEEQQTAAAETAAETAPATETAAQATEEEAETKVAMADQASQNAEAKVAETEEKAAEQEKQAPASESTTEMAKVDIDSATSDKSVAKSEAVVAVQPTLRIDAVEIEDGRMFVAGSATPGGSVQVFADGNAIGSSAVSGSGRFLVEAQKDIAVGDHTISAELYMKAGEAPAIRVAVPFTRPQGEMVAAVAAPKAATNAEEVSETTAKSKTEAPAPSETVAEAPAVSEENTSQVASAEPETAVIEQGSADDSQPATEQTLVASADTQDATKTVVQPALEPRDSSVIIRRGDTLWQISRRIYGRGVRYTTIYLANTDQIKNPDMIEPGQIFMVPEEPLANAEELHRQRIRNR